MIECIAVTHEDMVSTVTYTNPPFNLLDIEIMDALVAAHQEADAHPDTRVIVTRSGLDGMFCNGLNPMTVLEADLDGRSAIFAGVGRMIHGLYSLRKPHIAVLNGPAMAGGAVFAITADFRYLDQDRGALCFAEAKVGVPVPEELAAIIAGVCSPAMLREVVMLGKNLKPEQALAAGLVDGIAPADGLEELVSTQVARLSRLSCDVVKACKASIRAPIWRRTESMLSESDAEFTRFLSDEYLGEGLKAFLEGRQPVFTK
ncbi:MAG: enoyl-CoA hydratase/isomerase family protein [Candidatus Hydrogenedentes bacterium]|nr:enoyl-CoA hydratase/isomerase family protein [Candidatus Hydrogenedentota bacterium]